MPRSLLKLPANSSEQNNTIEDGYSAVDFWVLKAPSTPLEVIKRYQFIIFGSVHFDKSFSIQTKRVAGMDRISQTRPIPRSHDGDKKCELEAKKCFCWLLVRRKIEQVVPRGRRCHSPRKRSFVVPLTFDIDTLPCFPCYALILPLLILTHCPVFMVKSGTTSMKLAKSSLALSCLQLFEN